MKKITLLCIGILVFLVSFNSVLGSWADDNLGYCKNIELNNTNNNDILTDYQILFEIGNETEMNNDYSDLRFYNTECNNSGSKLDYWIRNYSDTQADIWVEVDSIPNNTYHNISMYYGNASYTSESNGTETFIIFEDFESDSVGGYARNWDEMGGWTTGVNWTIQSNGTNNILQFSGISPAGNGGGIFYNVTDLNVSVQAYTIEGVFKANSSNRRLGIFTDSNGYSSTREGYNSITDYSGTGRFRRIISGSFTDLIYPLTETYETNWNSFNYTRARDSGTNYITFYINDTLIHNFTDGVLTLENGYIGLEQEINDFTFFDNITTRVWANHTPQYVVTNEQSATTTTTSTTTTTTTSTTTTSTTTTIIPTTTTIGLLFGNYTTYSCNGEWLVENLTNFYGNSTDNTSEEVLSYTKCDYNCSETILGIRCNYSPFLRNGMIIGIFVLLLFGFYIIWRIIGVLI